MMPKKKPTIFKKLVVLAAVCFLNACQTLPEPETEEPLELFSPDEMETMHNGGKKENRHHSKQNFFSHKVRWEGEMLMYISQWYTGTTANWREIAAANPGLDPKRIRIDDVINIPEELIKIRTPMPRDYLSSYPKKDRYSPAVKSTSPTVSEHASGVSPKQLSDSSSKPKKDDLEIELFGPVDLD